MKNKGAFSEVDRVSTATVLTVDDDIMTTVFYGAVLFSPYDVHTAGSGVEALEACKMLMPDLILLDVEMPCLRRPKRLKASAKNSS